MTETNTPAPKADEKPKTVKATTINGTKVEGPAAAVAKMQTKK